MLSDLTMKLTLWQKVFIGIALGILFGYLFPEYQYIAKPFATIYTNLVYMIVVPTVFFAILYGMTNISDLHTLGRIGLKASAIYLLVTIIAVTVGILFAQAFEPGIGVNLVGEIGQTTTNIASNKTTTIQEIIINMFPKNPVSAMASGNTLQIVIFAFILGLSLILAGEKANEARKLILSVTAVVFKMVELIIKTTPYGVFAIMMWIVGEYGFSLAISLGKLTTVILSAFSLQYILFGIMLLIFGLNPIKFYRKTFNIQSLAFATSSSKATIMVAIKELQEKTGVSKKVASFILPLGAAINMTGTAIYIAVCALFFAQMLGIQLTQHQYIILIATSTIGSIGAAGYPSGGVFMLSMVLSSIGMPIYGIPFIMAIDRFVDMFRTVVNVTGDCAVTVTVDKIENSLDVKKYND